MCNGHALDALIECLDKLVHGAAALLRVHGNHANARKHVLDAVVKLCDQHALVLFGSLAFRDVTGQALDT